MLSAIFQQLVESQNVDSVIAKWGIGVSALSIIISGIIAILVFTIGNKKEKKRYKENKLNELELYKETIIDWVDRLGISVRKLDDYLTEFIKNLEKSDDIDAEALNWDIVLTNKLQEIPLNIWNDVFVRNHKGDRNENKKDMVNIVYQIEYIDAITKEIRRFYSDYHDRVVILLEKWNDNYIGLLNKGWQCQCHNKPFLFYLNKCLNNIPNPQSVKDLTQYLITPMLKYISVPSNCSADTALAELYINKLAITFAERESNNKGNVILFKQKSEQLNTSYSELKKSIDNIKEREFVDVDDIK